MSHKTPEVTKLVLTLTKGRDRFKLKRRYCFQGDDTPDELKKDADSFINTVLYGYTDKLKLDESITHRVLSRKVYMNDREY